jgi:hypothetical protein
MKQIIKALILLSKVLVWFGHIYSLLKHFL